MRAFDPRPRAGVKPHGRPKPIDGPIDPGRGLTRPLRQAALHAAVDHLPDESRGRPSPATAAALHGVDVR
jgi:hypothetical protein